jgi:hypothetical protein
MTKLGLVINEIVGGIRKPAPNDLTLLMSVIKSLAVYSLWSKELKIYGLILMNWMKKGSKCR